MYRQRTLNSPSTITKPITSRPVTRSFGRDITNTGVSSESGDPQLLEYLHEPILGHLHETEPAHLPSSSYMMEQTDINEKMRAILVDWLLEVS